MKGRLVTRCYGTWHVYDTVFFVRRGCELGVSNGGRMSRVTMVMLLLGGHWELGRRERSSNCHIVSMKEDNAASGRLQYIGKRQR